MGRPKKPEGTRASDVVATGVRLPIDLREKLEREADINQRSLTQEILTRLRASFDSGELQNRLEATRAIQLHGAMGAVLRAHEPQPMAPVAQPLGDSQRLLLSCFAALPPDKQLALLTLLKR